MQRSTKEGLKRVVAGLFLAYITTAGVAATFRIILIENVYDAVVLIPILFFSLGYVARYVYLSMKGA